MNIDMASDSSVSFDVPVGDTWNFNFMTDEFFCMVTVTNGLNYPAHFERDFITGYGDMGLLDARDAGDDPTEISYNNDIEDPPNGTCTMCAIYNRDSFGEVTLNFEMEENDT